MKQRGQIKKKPIPYAVKRQLQDPKIPVLVKDFHGVNWWEKTRMFPIFTIYHSPSDFPDKYVVRLFDGPLPTRFHSVKNSLEEARATIPELFRRMDRQPNDVPAIVETWL